MPVAGKMRLLQWIGSEMFLPTSGPMVLNLWWKLIKGKVKRRLPPRLLRQLKKTLTVTQGVQKPESPERSVKKLGPPQVVQRSESPERAAKQHEHPERDQDSTIGNKWGKRKWADERDEPDDEYPGLFFGSYRRVKCARP